ncbi:MAG: 2-oxoacid:acceptor oxidoreductase subunit alpha [Candidatus Omnitrophota bacterium]
MDEFSLLIAGKAGDGIDTAGFLIAHILNKLGFRLYIYRDYPSIIRGGHTFSIIRASKDRIYTHSNKIDFILALNQDSIDFHKEKIKNKGIIIFNSDLVKEDSLPDDKKCLGFSLEKIVKEENVTLIMRNSCAIGIFCKIIGIEWENLDSVFRKNISKEIDLNLKLARRGYDLAENLVKIKAISQEPLPLINGSEAIGLGLVKAGLGNYIAYPMTPSSGLLHFLAANADDFGIKVIHPESEIAVVLMALGFSYTGQKTAVGTSGGGFCLMTEGLSLSGMAELPIVFMVGQRTGPSTGLPTYTGQSELQFILNAGHGEFSRFVIAPGDAEEAYFASQLAMNLAWKYQIPAFILTDKTLNEGIYNFDINISKNLIEEMPIIWDKANPYKRYLDTKNGISPLRFVPDKDAIIKVNSYEHDEFGITTEEASITKLMQEKRLRKEKYLEKELESYQAVKIYGNKKSKTAILCWGSNKGVCLEVADKLGLKVIQPLVLWPFPGRQFKNATKGLKKIICIENNATGQLEKLIKLYGFSIHKKITRYDGRPFSLDELEEKLKK